MTGGTVVSDGSARALDVGVIGEQIAVLGAPGTLGDAREVVDARGCYVIPGGIDAHCHYNLCRPGNPDVCGEPQEFSPAAAFGGTTTVIDFAVQEPPQSLHEAVAAKRAEADGSMAVDYGLHAILTRDVSFEVLDEIGDVIASGIPSIKTTTTYSWMVDDGHRFGVMREVAKNGGISLVHAEDDALAKWFTKEYLRQGKTAGAYVSETRNALVEEAAIRRVSLLAERSGSALYILHMAAARGMEALAEGQARGLPFYGETLPAYLSFTQDDLWRHGDRSLLYNNFPTLKTGSDRAAIWQALADGRIQTVSSDHQAYKVEHRLDRVGTTVDSMCGGQAAVELRLPVVYHLGVAEGRLPITRFVEVVSTSPAKLMGLYPRKGTIAAGSDADIVVLDPNRSWTVDYRELHMSSDYSCWQDWKLSGSVRMTILRGTTLVRDGNYVGPRNGGKFIPRRIAAEFTESFAAIAQ